MWNALLEESHMADCNMQGVLLLEQAQAALASRLSTELELESLPLLTALGRVLARPVLARLPSPLFDNSAMDGFALKAADLASQAALPICGTALAGHPFTDEWPDGTVVRIMTGAPVPDGCAAVVMQEQTCCDGEAITLQAEVRAGQNIRRAGEDILAGSRVLAAGERLTARNLPLLAAVGVSHVDVFKPLKVAFFSSGDELKGVDEPLGPGQIIDSNRYALHALLTRLGCELLDLGVIPDDKAALRDAFLHADAHADVLISSGGVSVGEADYTKAILAELGEVAFWKVAIKPGKPFACGRLVHAPRRSWFFGLPGNPVSALVTFLLLVRPALEQLMGLTVSEPLRFKATTSEPLKLSAGRIDFQRGIVSQGADGRLSVSLAGEQGSGMFMALSRANCLIRLDANAEPDRKVLEAGSEVEIVLFDEVMK